MECVTFIQSLLWIPIYLAVLCKADYVKTDGFDNVLEPLKISKKPGGPWCYVPLLGTSLKDTVHSV